ncbi:dockerin type I domain-containing protein [Pseudobacteroides cellulosolvens]|nr:dockerin type I domain-containing protein [Pseudobacteroides cellulosolvens]
MFLDNTNSHGAPGDINNDKKVNMLDVVILAKSFGSISGDDLFNAR